MVQAKEMTLWRKWRRDTVRSVCWEMGPGCVALLTPREWCVASDTPLLYLLASSTPTSTITWISWFCSLPGHEYFCEVTEDFIEDDFNLTGLNTMVPFWKEAMDMVLDVEPGVDVQLISPGQCRSDDRSLRSQMKTHRKFLTCRSWSPRQRCSMALSINVTSSREPDCKRWYDPFAGISSQTTISLVRWTSTKQAYLGHARASIV